MQIDFVEDEENILGNSERSHRSGGRLDVSVDTKHRQTARLKKLRQLGRKKQARLMKQNLERQVMFFGQTQYKFLQTTNQQGALLDDDQMDDYGEEASEAPQVKSLWQQTQDKARLFNCLRCCKR